MKSVLGPTRRPDAQLVDHLFQYRLEGNSSLEGQREATAEATAREVENIVDQARHPDDAAMHHAQNLRASFAQSLLAKKADAATNGRERIAQIMPKHGDELLAKGRCVLLVEQVLIGCADPFHAFGRWC